jgi:hypothetical protein
VATTATYKDSFYRPAAAAWQENKQFPLYSLATRSIRPDPARSIRTSDLDVDTHFPAAGIIAQARRCP